MVKLDPCSRPMVLSVYVELVQLLPDTRLNMAVFFMRAIKGFSAAGGAFPTAPLVMVDDQQAEELTDDERLAEFLHFTEKSRDVCALYFGSFKSFVARLKMVLLHFELFKDANLISWRCSLRCGSL